MKSAPAVSLVSDCHSCAAITNIHSYDRKDQ
jgi:hypothetical protein